MKTRDLPSGPVDSDISLDGFHCIQCQACCRQSGYVRLHPSEPDVIAEFLGMEVREFIETYTHLTRDRQCLSLIDQEGGACIFLEKTGCRIHPVKPQQCKNFPHGWRFSDFKAVCGWAKNRDADGE